MLTIILTVLAVYGAGHVLADIMDAASRHRSEEEINRVVDRIGW